MKLSTFSSELGTTMCVQHSVGGCAVVCQQLAFVFYNCCDFEWTY